MRGRVIAVLFFFFFAAGTATPQCNFQLEYSGAYRASYLDLAIDGNDLWAATGYGLQLFDRSIDPPRLIDSIALPGLTRTIRANGGIAYVGSGTSIHVVRKAGVSLQLVRAVDVAGTVNELAMTSDSLYAATSNGIASFSLRDPLKPEGGLTQAQTSSRSVLSIAATGTEVYAADGDGSVEMFTRTAQTLTAKGQLLGLPRSLSVRVIGTRVYVSDGQRTAVFTAGSTGKLAEFPFGTSSIIDSGGNLLYVAGNDRQWHALDLGALEQPVELFETEVLPSGGSINRITALAEAGNRLFVAGGDTGVLAYDVSAFGPPYPLRSYGFGAKTSLTSTTGVVYVSDATGGLSELTRSQNGSLTAARHWASGAHLVHDTARSFLLTSTGATATYWAASSLSSVSSVSFRAPVRSAVLFGTGAYALLDDGTLWSADVTQQNPAPVRLTTPGGALSFLGRSARGIAAAEITSEGNTDVHYVAEANFSAAPITVHVPGAATALAMSESRVAVFTFRGTNLIDFSQSPPVVTVLAQSNSVLVGDIVIGGNRLVDLARDTVRVWNLATGSVERQFALPTEGTAIDIADDSNLVAVATSSGVVSLNLQSSSKQPTLVTTIGGNDYYKKAAGTSKRLILFDGREVDVFETTSSAPRLVGSINSPGLLDVAVSDSSIFTLSGNGTIAAFSPDGTLLRSTTVNEGSDAVPIAIAPVRGAAWASISKGCLTTGCETKTLVYDPQSLVRTATLTGATIDVATTSGNRAYALFDQPKVLRVYDVSDPLHPSQLSSRAPEGDAASVATSGGTVYALGDKLYAYSEPALTKIGEQFDLLQPSASTRIAIDGDCAVITGRSPAAQAYSVTAGAWPLQRTFDLPGTVKSLIVQNGRIVILTDYSIEIWSRAVTKPARRHALQ